jgi:hypothetical protein
MVTSTDRHIFWFDPGSSSCLSMSSSCVSEIESALRLLRLGNDLPVGRLADQEAALGFSPLKARWKNGRRVGMHAATMTTFCSTLICY